MQTEKLRGGLKKILSVKQHPVILIYLFPNITKIVNGLKVKMIKWLQNS